MSQLHRGVATRKSSGGEDWQLWTELLLSENLSLKLLIFLHRARGDSSLPETERGVQEHLEISAEN